MQAKLKRWLGFVAKSSLLLVVVAVVAGIAYEPIGERKDRQRFP